MPKRSKLQRDATTNHAHPISLGAHYLEEMAVNLGAARAYAANDFNTKEMVVLVKMGKLLKILHDRQQKRNA